MVETPVLFETFVRVDYARQVWNAIKKAQPKKLYFYSNKGRAEKEGEDSKNGRIDNTLSIMAFPMSINAMTSDCISFLLAIISSLIRLF